MERFSVNTVWMSRTEKDIARLVPIAEAGIALDFKINEVSSVL